MQCPAQQYAYDTLKDNPLEKWIKYNDNVYILNSLDDEIIILLCNYGSVPKAYKSWITNSCSNIIMKLNLDLQIVCLQENNEIPILKKMD